MTMVPDIHWSNLLAAAVYAGIGLLFLGITFWIWEKVTPYSLWKELIDEHNTALAIVVASLVLGMSVIIASAIR